MKKLFYIKLVHTIIWLFYVCIIFYILFAAILDKIDIYLYIAIILVIFEWIILIIFKGKCPLTIIAYRYSKNHEAGFDIFLPKWLAESNKSIFTLIFILGIIIVLYRNFG
ncbi:MAG: hypothetical protein ACD_3C00226G0001 [uncultured bacterium (gcode 4)]|uniref:DUF2784 domain-containing protein n=1 Tax=uncultured bacterium (gcode 4) TaxID=1234023 RepID=K2FZC7_9BACT|nr:MAG: hypothetical protein ACD_3C00226G0001 [uncultured bacterium (gcode 4)]